MLSQLQSEKNRSKYTPDYLEKHFTSVNSKQWQKRGEAFALSLFHHTAKRVPAYRDFLKSHHIRPELIKTYHDYSQVPCTDKKNYIDKHSFEELVWDGDIRPQHIINASSGSTGKPYYWLTHSSEFLQGAAIHQYIFEKIFSLKTPTLVIINFGMGTWVAGMFTFLSTYFAGNQTSPISVVTPGFNKEETISILNSVAPQYTTIVMAGYPTFIKDVMARVQTKKLPSMRFLLAGEAITESWRSRIADIASHGNVFDICCVLGSADAAFMGFETRDTIAIRRAIDDNVEMKRALFGEERTPSIMTYIPNFRFFESVDHHLVLTAHRAMPLIRYNTLDFGGVISMDQMMNTLPNNAQVWGNFQSHCSNTRLNLPLVYLFGRGKFNATIYAANIYPENVKEVLLDPSVAQKVTGRFEICTQFTSQHDHFLELHIELGEQITPDPDLEHQISHVFMKRVTQLNSEYRTIVREYGEKVRPKVKLYSYGDTSKFPAGKVKKTS